MSLPNAKGVLLEGRQRNDSLGILLSQLATQSAALVRDEVALARQELREKMFSLRSTLLIVAVGIVMGFFALQMLYAAATALVTKVLTDYLKSRLNGLAEYDDTAPQNRKQEQIANNKRIANADLSVSKSEKV